MIRNLTDKRVILFGEHDQKISIPPEGAVKLIECYSWVIHDGIKVENSNGKTPVYLPNEAKNTIFIVDEAVKSSCFQRQDLVTLPPDATKTVLGDAFLCDKLIR